MIFCKFIMVDILTIFINLMSNDFLTQKWIKLPYFI